MSDNERNSEDEPIPKHPSEDTARLDYASTLVPPEAYILICPSCKYRHEAESTLAYRCPNCNKAISVKI